MTEESRQYLADQQGPGRWQKSRGWLLVILLLLVEGALFRQFAQGEVAWAVPLSYDQSAYLAQSYAIHEQIKDKGLVGGLAAALGAGAESGVLVQVEAGLLFLLLGPSRLAALALNFLHFAL